MSEKIMGIIGIEETEESMKEAIKKVLKADNPVDEYLNNYKDQKLAEFCVVKDKNIKSLREENHRYAEELVEIKQKVEKYDKIFSDVKELYREIHRLSVDDYLYLYHMMRDDISGRNKPSVCLNPTIVSSWTKEGTYL